MPVANKVCKVTGIPFSLSGDFLPKTDDVIHPSLYGIEVSYLLNVTRTLLSNKRYDLVAEQVTRFLFIKSLWAVEIDSVYLTPITDELEPEDIRAELLISIDLHDCIPINRFKITKVGSRPWHYLKEILKQYGNTYQPKGRNLEERLSRSTDDILAGRVVLASELLASNDVVSIINLLEILRTLPIEYLREIGIKNKDKELLSLLVRFDKFMTDNKRIL